VKAELFAIRRVLESGQFILNREVEAFEKELSAYLKMPGVLGVNSGTDALVIALEALGIGEGDEVITTPFTFFATTEAILRVGAKPVFCDIDKTFCINPDLIEKKITSRTQAILVVHLFGQLCDMIRICSIAENHNLLIIEDAAQALGVKGLGQGDAVCLSFYPTKNLPGIGDGGAIVFKEEGAYRRAEMLRNHGQRDRKHYHEHIGYNSRLDEIQAAVLRVRLKKLDSYITIRRGLAEIYNANLDCPPVAIRDHTYNQYVIRVKDREDLRGQLSFPTSVYYPLPIYKQKACRQNIVCPQTEQACKETLALPIGHKMKPEDILPVISEVNNGRQASPAS